MRQVNKLRLIGSLFAVATVIYAINTKQSHGSFLRVPFEFRMPTPQRIRKRWWNREDKRIFTPHVFGIGWSVNLYQVGKRLGFVQDNEGPENES